MLVIAYASCIAVARAEYAAFSAPVYAVIADPIAASRVATAAPTHIILADAFTEVVITVVEAIVPVSAKANGAATSSMLTTTPDEIIVFVNINGSIQINNCLASFSKYTSFLEGSNPVRAWRNNPVDMA